MSSLRAGLSSAEGPRERRRVLSRGSSQAHLFPVAAGRREAPEASRDPNPALPSWGHAPLASEPLLLRLLAPGFHHLKLLFLCRPWGPPLAPPLLPATGWVICGLHGRVRTLPAGGEHRWALSRLISL